MMTPAQKRAITKEFRKNERARLVKVVEKLNCLLEENSVYISTEEDSKFLLLVSDCDEKVKLVLGHTQNGKLVNCPWLR